MARCTGLWVLAEDSGIEVKSLGGKPGIYSARYSDPNATARKNNLKLLRALARVPPKKRQARYKCVAVLTSPQKVIKITEGECKGYVAATLRGKNGFGYDPLFLVPKYGKTFGELPQSIKNQISHRAKAIKKMSHRLHR